MHKVTLYENSHVNGSPHFSITPLPVKIESANPSGQACASGLNDYQPGVQASSPPPTNPWTGGRPPSPNNPTIGLMSITAGFGGQPDDNGFVPGGPTAQPMLPLPSIPPQRASSGTETPLKTITVTVSSIQKIEFTTTIHGQPTVQTSS